MAGWLRGSSTPRSPAASQPNHENANWLTLNPTKPGIQNTESEWGHDSSQTPGLRFCKIKAQKKFKTLHSEVDKDMGQNWFMLGRPSFLHIALEALGPRHLYGCSTVHTDKASPRFPAKGASKCGDSKGRSGSGTGGPRGTGPFKKASVQTCKTSSTD